MKKVLVIEDDAPLCWLLEKILSKKYEVVVMNNGLEAWCWLTEGNHPDLIISDIKMPSLDGLPQFAPCKGRCRREMLHDGHRARRGVVDGDSGGVLAVQDGLAPARRGA